MIPQGYEFQYEPFRKAQLEGRAEGRAEGEARGRAEGIIEVLSVRGVSLTEEQQQRITSCMDLDTLRRWVRRSATVSHADELFSEE